MTSKGKGLTGEGYWCHLIAKAVVKIFNKKFHKYFTHIFA